MDNFSQPSTSTYQPSRIVQSETRHETNDVETISLKSDYIHLLDEANAIAGNPNIRQSITQINNVIDRADQLFLKVKNTPEMYLDAKILHSTTTSLEQTTYNLDVGEGSFKLFAFAEQFKIKALNNEGKPSWQVLASVAQPVVQNSIPFWSPLLGSFEFTAEVSASQQKRPRQQRQKDQDVEKKEPEKLSQVDKTQEGVEEIVKRIFVKLKKHYRENRKQPISYFRFVVNPMSFSETVENIFHVSFLVNDGLVKLELDDDEPMIFPVSKGKENSNPETEPQVKEKKQNIFSIDMETWKDLILVMDIKSAMV